MLRASARMSDVEIADNKPYTNEVKGCPAVRALEKSKLI